MDLKDKLLALMRAQDYAPLRREEIAGVLKLGKGDRRAFHDLVDAMLESGEIARLKKDRLCIPEDADLVSGRIVFRQSGSATVIPERTPSVPVADGYPVAAEDTGVALHGDQVLARITERPRRRGRRGGPPEEPSKPNVRVIRILKRARETFTGTLELGRHYAYVIPDDPRIIQDILVPDPRNAAVKPRPKKGDKVVVRLVEWKQRHLNPAGEITEVLGKTHEPDAEFKAILHTYNLSPGFPEAVMRQARGIPEKVRAADIRGRQDCRGLFTFTIDPDDAKDFDDALSLERLDGGQTRIGVHIADVSAYVKPGDPLDREAQERGNSTYLVGTVIPMLPHALSNGLCSLVEAEDRLTKTAFLTFAADGAVAGVEFANTVIRSNKRLTYKQAYAFMKEDDLDAVRATPLPPAHQTGSTGRSLDELDGREMRQLRDDIRALWQIASRLRARRFRQGSLDLDMPEVKIYVDEDGYADRIVKEEYDESHQLIEEFMLAANEQVARSLKRHRVPGIYRVHDKPEEEKLNELRETMQVHGVDCGNLNQPKEMSALLAKLKEHPQGHILKVQVLRSLKQACYRGSPDGHYGLAKKDYTHFTSPIRRYSDLVVHRILDGFLHQSGASSAPKNLGIRYQQAQVDSLGDHLSITERNSVEAERASVKTKLLEFYERELEKSDKQTFQAVVTDLKNHGLFVELTDSLAFGLVHVSTLDDDLYQLSRDGTVLAGRRTRKQFTAGQYVHVQVERVDRFKRQIDFRIVGDAADDTRRKKSQPSTTGDGRKRAARPPAKNKREKSGRGTGNRQAETSGKQSAPKSRRNRRNTRRR
jgi:ribonuclease R